MIDSFTMKLINPTKHPHSHPNLPPMHPLHPRLICVWAIASIASYENCRFVMTLGMICNELRIDLFHMKLRKPPKHRDSHHNPPPVYPLHPWLICVWSVCFPSIWPIYLSVIALLWPNKWYFVSLFQFLHVIHHQAMEMHRGCHPLSPKSLPTLNQLFCLKTCHPIVSIVSQ